MQKCRSQIDRGAQRPMSEAAMTNVFQETDLSGNLGMIQASEGTGQWRSVAFTQLLEAVNLVAFFSSPAYEQVAAW